MNLFEISYQKDVNVLIGTLTLVEMSIAFGCIAVLILGYLLSPKIQRFIELQKKQKLQKKNKNTLQDLRTMKEIQGEIEEEMKQALIAKALREKERK